MRPSRKQGSSAVAAAALVFAVVIAPPGLAGGKPGSSGPKPGGLEMFVSGTLADSDGRPLEAKSAEATAFAFDRADGVASIEVTVDGKRVAIDRLKCKGSCPQSTTFDFKYVAKRYGNDHHDIAMTATDGTGHDLTRYVSIDRKPAGGPGGAPTPVPAFYITAPNENDLSRQVSKAAERVADKQGSGRTLLALDFGAARLKGNTYGSALRSGTFFSNDQIKTALEAAARSYRQHRRRGAITIVYVNTNGNISDPGKGYTKFDKKTARTAGENQGKVVADLKVFPHITAAVGGDIEPGYDSQPELATEMVDGAVHGSGDKPYYNFGTAPCSGDNCTNGWNVQHICDTTTGESRQAVPEIYNVSPVDQAQVWGKIQNDCKIESFPGTSANLLGSLEPQQSWVRLKKTTGVNVGNALVVWPK